MTSRSWQPKQGIVRVELEEKAETEEGNKTTKREANEEKTRVKDEGEETEEEDW